MGSTFKVHFELGSSRIHKAMLLLPQPFLNTSPQTPCWSQWPAWLFTPAMSSCRSISWPSCTTSRLYSDTLTPSICLWPSVCWSTCLTSLVPRRLLDSRQGLMLTMLRRIFSPVLQSWFDMCSRSCWMKSFPGTVSPAKNLRFWPMWTLRWGEGAFDSLLYLYLLWLCTPHCWQKMWIM